MYLPHHIRAVATAFEGLRAYQLTLSQPGGTTGNPGFSNLPTALQYILRSLL